LSNVFLSFEYRDGKCKLECGFPSGDMIIPCLLSIS